MGCFPIVYLGWFDFAQVPIDFSLYFAMDFDLEQPPRSSYAGLPSYIPYMSHLSTLPLCEWPKSPMPILLVNRSCLSLAKALVSTSTNISSVGQYSKMIAPLATFSCTKWYCTSMCFVLAWYTGFFASAMAPWLSHMIKVPSSYLHLTSSKGCLNHIWLLLCNGWPPCTPPPLWTRPLWATSCYSMTSLHLQG
jgi:hypothetical protein